MIFQQHKYQTLSDLKIQVSSEKLVDINKKNLLTSMPVKILQSAMMDFYCVINLFYIILEAQRLEAEISWHVDQTDEENM